MGKGLMGYFLVMRCRRTRVGALEAPDRETTWVAAKAADQGSRPGQPAKAASQGSLSSRSTLHATAEWRRRGCGVALDDNAVVFRGIRGIA